MKQQHRLQHYLDKNGADTVETTVSCSACKTPKNDNTRHFNGSICALCSAKLAQMYLCWLDLMSLLSGQHHILLTLDVLAGTDSSLSRVATPSVSRLYTAVGCSSWHNWGLMGKNWSAGLPPNQLTHRLVKPVREGHLADDHLCCQCIGARVCLSLRQRPSERPADRSKASAFVQYSSCLFVRPDWYM